MKYRLFSSLLLLTVLFSVSAAYGWGIWGHNHINKGAVLALPAEMGLFFYNHSDFLTQESTIPDIRKYTINDRAEFCRHYVNLEKYNYEGREMMPKKLSEVIAKIGKDSTDRYGILPWYIQDMMAKLTDAMKNKHKTQILFLAGDLGHYIGDAHMPLHTTVNHDGQSTGQNGIHSFWECQLPELFGKDYNLYSGEAHYIKDIEKAVWDILDTSFLLSDKMLTIEKKLKDQNPLDKQYEIGADGKPKKNDFGQQIHSYEYAHIYHELLQGMVERQMRSALMYTADFWYTAWVNAGKPDLSSMDPDYLDARNKPFYKEDLKAWKKGKVKGCASERDYPVMKGH